MAYEQRKAESTKKSYKEYGTRKKVDIFMEIYEVREEIKKLQNKLPELMRELEVHRQKGIKSRESFYRDQAKIYGQIMEKVYLLEMIHCKTIPHYFDRNELMLDFKGYQIESGLHNALKDIGEELEKCSQ